MTICKLSYTMPGFNILVCAVFHNLNLKQLVQDTGIKAIMCIVYTLLIKIIKYLNIPYYLRFQKISGHIEWLINT